MAKEVSMEFAFFEFLRSFYLDNKGIIRNRYREITKKYLDYNDKEKNPDAFLRKPQFEALEMYVFVKEFMDNQQMYQMFDDWSKRNGVFADRRFYDESGQLTLYDVYSPKQYHDYFLQIKKYAEAYPNYIYALTMGLGKTILMATCIFYEFLLASKWPRDEKYCHNALVFAPDKTVLQSLKEIVTFDKSKVVPPEYIGVLDSNIKVHFMEDSGTTLNTLDGSKYNIIISNTQKIILKAQHKEKSAVDRLFNDQIPGQSALDDVLGILQEISNNDDLMSNQRFEKLTRLSQMGIYVDEAHHMFGADLEKALHENGKGTSLRNTINELAKELAAHGSKVVACYNFTGTPYVNNKILPEVVYAYGLQAAIRNNFLKDTSVIGYSNVKNKEFLKAVISDFWEKYGGKEYEGLLPKMAIFGAEVAEVQDEIRPVVEEVLSELGIPLDKILVNNEIKAMITAFGTVLPPLIIISVISFFYQQFRSNYYVNAVMLGMQAGVAAVICSVVLDMSRSVLAGRNLAAGLILAGVFTAVYFFKVNVFWVILICGCIGFFGVLDRCRKAGKGKEKDA